MHVLLFSKRIREKDLEGHDETVSFLQGKVWTGQKSVKCYKIKKVATKLIFLQERVWTGQKSVK